MDVVTFDVGMGVGEEVALLVGAVWGVKVALGVGVLGVGGLGVDVLFAVGVGVAVGGPGGDRTVRVSITKDPLS